MELAIKYPESYINFCEDNDVALLSELSYIMFEDYFKNYK